MKYIVYHGTGVNFRKFNLKKTTQGLFWFTDNKESILAKEVGAQTNGFIYKCEIEINKPCGWAEYDKLVQGQIAKLYDGIILPDGEFNTYVVWDPSKIKILEKQKLTEARDAAYLSWKRKNVTIRGIKVEEVITEDITLDIDKGDTILTGRFKNHKVEVKDIGEDEHGMPTVNGKQITKVRIPKIEESFIEKILREAYSYKKVKSSNLEIVGYDPKAKTMQVKFHSGNIYEFSAVSRFVYDALLQSESKGQFFNKFIKGRFECQKLEPTNI